MLCCMVLEFAANFTLVLLSQKRGASFKKRDAGQSTKLVPKSGTVVKYVFKCELGLPIVIHPEEAAEKSARKTRLWEGMELVIWRSLEKMG